MTPALFTACAEALGGWRNTATALGCDERTASRYGTGAIATIPMEHQKRLKGALYAKQTALLALAAQIAA